MTRARVLALTVLAGAALVALSNSCALITCVEDDCASVATGGSSSTATGSTGPGGAGGNSGLSATSTGPGGGEPCTTHCLTDQCALEMCQPKCSKLPATGLAVTATALAAFALTEAGSGGGGSATLQKVTTVGDSPTEISGSFAADGRLTSQGVTVYYGFGPNLRDIDGLCTFDLGTVDFVAAAGTPDRSIWLTETEVRAFDGCAPLTGHPVNGGFAVAAAPSGADTRIAVGSGQASQQICGLVFGDSMFEELNCITGLTAVGSVALTPDGGSIVFSTGSAVMSAAFGTNDASELWSTTGILGAIGVTPGFFFVGRTAPPSDEGTLVRCPNDDPAAGCRSFGTAPVRAIHAEGSAVYFTMGNQLCKWE